MRISTKGRYALRLMTDVAIYGEKGNVSLKDVAERQNISMKMPNRTLILFDRPMEEQAIHETMLYRKQGGRAALMKFYEERTMDDYKNYCKANQLQQILYLKQDGEKEIIQIG